MPNEKTYTARELAEHTGISKRSILRRANREHWQVVIGQGNGGDGNGLVHVFLHEKGAGWHPPRSGWSVQSAPIYSPASWGPSKERRHP